MKIGFTGTSQGISLQQDAFLYKCLLKCPIIEFHHGDCTGADEHAHQMVHKFSRLIQIIIHPPDNPYKRAYCSPGLLREEKPYLVRDHDIVDETELLIACPGQEHEIQHSGTWTTIRYAKKKKKKIIIIYPSGRTEYVNMGRSKIL